MTGNGKGGRGLEKGWGDVFSKYIRKVKPYCTWVCVYNHAKEANSRKKNAPFFRGRLKCSHVSCTAEAELTIQDDDMKKRTVAAKFKSKTVTHAMGQPKAGKITGDRRVELNKQLRMQAPPSVYRGSLANMSSDLFPSGKGFRF